MQKEQPELGEAISQAIAQKITPEFVQEKVNERAEKLVEESIRDAMQSYGDIGSAVKKAIKESLQVDNLDLPSYGHVVTSMVQAQIEAIVSPLVAGQLSKDMEELLKLAPKTIKLSEIVETIIEENDYTEFGEGCTCIVDRNEHGSTWISLDETVVKEERSTFSTRSSNAAYKCEIRMLVGSDGTISSATFNGDEMKTMRRVGHDTYGLEQRIRAYHACGTIIEIDEDNVSTYRDID